jgi:hypothetical protein
MTKHTVQGFHFLQDRRWRKSIVASVKTILTLLLVNFFSSNLLAQVPQIDGSPAEWPGILNNATNTSKGFKHDPFNANKVDDSWTGGSQDNDASCSADWTWVLGNSNDKGDIGNAGTVKIGSLLYFCGDRSSLSGDAQIGFWFFKDNVQPTGAGSNPGSPFSGEHTNGDLLIISNFTNGGGTGAPAVYEWKNKTSNSPGGLVQLSLNTAPALLTTNSSSVASPNGTAMFNGQTWLFQAKGTSGNNHNYLTNLFFEGYVDLTNIPEAACFQRFVLETRNSASIGASLQDLAAGNFGARPAPPVVTITEANLCSTLTAPSLTVNCPVAGVYKLTQTGETPITKTFPTDGVNGELVFGNLRDGKGFEVYVDNGGCLSDITDCTNYTSFSCPASTLSVRQSSSTDNTLLIGTEPKVLATPNPFGDNVRFSVEAPISGQGTLELYNMLGQKVKTVFQGYFEKDRMQTIEYRVPTALRSNLTYLFRIGDRKTTGKLIGLK